VVLVRRFSWAINEVTLVWIESPIDNKGASYRPKAELAKCWSYRV
jgi:hypothetical protein